MRETDATILELQEKLKTAMSEIELVKFGIEGYEKQINSYIDRIQKFTANLAKHELVFNMLRTELLAVQSRVSASNKSLNTEEKMGKNISTKILALQKDISGKLYL